MGISESCPNGTDAGPSERAGDRLRQHCGEASAGWNPISFVVFVVVAGVTCRRMHCAWGAGSLRPACGGGLHGLAPGPGAGKVLLPYPGIRLPESERACPVNEGNGIPGMKQARCRQPASCSAYRHFPSDAGKQPGLSSPSRHILQGPALYPDCGSLPRWLRLSVFRNIRRSESPPFSV